MGRRSVAGLVAAMLLVGFVVLLSRQAVPYVTLSPGPTVDILGSRDDEEIVEVSGARTYPTEGQLRLTTISVTRPQSRLRLVDALAGWLRRDTAVLPYDSIYPEGNTNEEERAVSAAQMVGSQDAATAAALSLLGYELPTYAEVTGVTPDGPSDGRLEARDRLLSLDGTRIRDVPGLFAALDQVQPGDEVTLRVRRQGETRHVRVRTGAADDDPTRPLLGVLVGTGFEFPFDVRVRIEEGIGGPSAGLMFALSIYDTLTPGALTGGEVVAGTGTIDVNGAVGPIGGIEQKIVGAEEAGATLFLVPPDNCAGALRAPVSPDAIRLVRAETLRSAVRSVRAYARDPDTDLPRCPS